MNTIQIRLSRTSRAVRASGGAEIHSTCTAKITK